jgi:NAD(P)-dependent dehydrogenase (short-subunit alcohol dehydrogenase family)
LKPKSLCNISGFSLIPQSYVKERIGPACPRSEISASAYSPRLISEPELGTSEEVAAAVLYLAPDVAKFTTGTTMILDGGLTVHRPFLL